MCQLTVSAQDEYIHECIFLRFIYTLFIPQQLNMEVDPSTIPLPEDTPTQPQQQDIKLPPFWTTRPRAWFTFVESPFRLRGIEDDNPDST